MAAVRERMPVQQYLDLPERTKPYLEYVRGKVRPKSMPDLAHGHVCDDLQARLRASRETHGGRSAPEVRIDFNTSEGPQFLIPDASFWREGASRRRQHAAAPPTVAIEVRSPDDTPAELREKCAFCVARGVAEAWLLDPVARTAEGFRAPGERLEVPGDGVLVSTVLPGFSVPLADLFAVLDRE